MPLIQLLEVLVVVGVLLWLVNRFIPMQSSIKSEDVAGRASFPSPWKSVSNQEMSLS